MKMSQVNVFMGVYKKGFSSTHSYMCCNHATNGKLSRYELKITVSCYYEELELIREWTVL